jgi:putative addiction module killer protein
VYEILHYQTIAGVDVINTWLGGLADPRAIARIVARVDRLQAGNFGDHKPIGQSVWELRIDYGPGYRVYYALAGHKIFSCCAAEMSGSSPLIFVGRF